MSLLHCLRVPVCLLTEKLRARYAPKMSQGAFCCIAGFLLLSGSWYNGFIKKGGSGICNESKTVWNMGNRQLAFNSLAGKYPYVDSVGNTALHFMGSVSKNRLVSAGRILVQSVGGMPPAMETEGQVRTGRYHEQCVWDAAWIFTL